MCQRCWQPLGRGIAYPIAPIFKCCKLNFTAFEDGGSNAILATRGSVLTTTKGVNSKKSRAHYCSNPVSAKEIIRFESTLGLSLKQTRTSVESSLAGKLSQCEKALEPFYSSSTMEFDVQNDNKKVKKLSTQSFFAMTCR